MAVRQRNSGETGEEKIPYCLKFSCAFIPAQTGIQTFEFQEISKNIKLPDSRLRGNDDWRFHQSASLSEVQDIFRRPFNG